MAEEIKRIAGEYNIPCCDAWHTSGINRFTWKHFTHSSVVMNPDYDPEKEYVAPYPQYADQSHMNDAGIRAPRRVHRRVCRRNIKFRGMR